MNIKPLHLNRPFKVAPYITQGYANLNDAEPLGSYLPDKSIFYDGSPTLGHYHNGIDYGLPCGTPLFAPADGQVTLTGISPSGFGLRLELLHASQVFTLYGHLSTILVDLNQHVKAGQPIATSGGGNRDIRDGNSDGCHLHWSTIRYTDGHYVFPGLYVFAPVGGC